MQQQQFRNEPTTESGYRTWNRALQKWGLARCSCVRARWNRLFVDNHGVNAPDPRPGRFVLSDEYLRLYQPANALPRVRIMVRFGSSKSSQSLWATVVAGVLLVAFSLQPALASAAAGPTLTAQPTSGLPGASL